MKDHWYIIGKSGSGKTTLLKNLLLDDDSGWAFIDPHGDSALEIADTVDCIYWDVAEGLVQYNPLHPMRDIDDHLIVEGVLSAIKARNLSSWGPNLEDVLRNALFVLYDNRLTLAQLPRLLADQSYRAKLMHNISNAEVRRFWRDEFAAKSAKQQAEELRSTQNKVRLFALNPTLNRTLSASTIDFGRLMRKGHRLVVNLSKGRLGDAPANLMGALIVAGFTNAALARARLAPEERPAFTLYVDEFQNFATDSFVSILSEARKYGLFIAAAHQFLGQIDDKLRQALLGNVGCFACFCVSAEDAHILAPEFGLHDPLEPFHERWYTEFCEHGIHTPLALSSLPAHTYRLRQRSGIDWWETTPRPTVSGRLDANRRHTRANYTRYPPRN